MFEILDVILAQRKVEIIYISYTQKINVECATTMYMTLNHIKEFGFSAEMQQNNIEEWANFQTSFSYI